jgi:hypothetical protein
VTWQFLVALIISIPVILFPIALLWFLDIGGIFSWVKQAFKRRKFQQENVEIAPLEQEADI